MYSRYEETGLFGIFVSPRIKIMVGNTYDDKVILELPTNTCIQITKALARNDTCEFSATYSTWNQDENKMVRIKCLCSMNINGISVADQVTGKQYAFTFNEEDKSVVNFVFNEKALMWISVLGNVIGGLEWSLGQLLKSVGMQPPTNDGQNQRQNQSQNPPATPPAPPPTPPSDGNSPNNDIPMDDDLPF